MRDPVIGNGTQRQPGGSAVEARELTKTYGGGVLAADRVSLRADAGEVVGLVGPNGAGKSTTLKMLATLVRPTSGEATICGVPISRPREVRPLLGVALQDLGLDPLMTGAEHFDVQAAISGLRPRSVKDRADTLVRRFDLVHYVDKSVGSYSGGTQRRLALALALLTDPRVVIFDEPTAGLDPRARRDVWKVVRELSEEGRTVLFCTQYLEEADHLCDRLYLIDRGAIVAEGRPRDLKGELTRSQLRMEFQDGQRLDVDAITANLPVEVEASEPSLLKLRFDRAAVSAREIFLEVERQNTEVRTFALSEATLDDVFFHHTKRAISPEPLEKGGMDLGTRMHRGGGKRWS